MMTVKTYAHKSEPEIDALESQLAGLFQPVTPRREFVSGLRTRLETPPQERTDTGQYLLLGVLGVLAAVVILVLGIRAGVALLTTLGLMQQVRGKVASRRPNSAI
jgi:hypothetical protein